eukprot:gene12576-6396_t
MEEAIDLEKLIADADFLLEDLYSLEMEEIETTKKRKFEEVQETREKEQKRAKVDLKFDNVTWNEEKRKLFPNFLGTMQTEHKFSNFDVTKIFIEENSIFIENEIEKVELQKYPFFLFFLKLNYIAIRANSVGGMLHLDIFMSDLCFFEEPIINNSQMNDQNYLLRLYWTQVFKCMKIYPFTINTHKDTVSIDLEGMIHEEVIKEEKKTDLESIKNFKLKLKDYQIDGLNWMIKLENEGVLNKDYIELKFQDGSPFYFSEKFGCLTLKRVSSPTKGGIIADSMGIGKTIQALALILKNPPKESNKPNLIVCPLSIIQQWTDEIKNHITKDFTIAAYVGPKRDKDPKSLQKFDIILTTYTTLAIDYKLYNSKNIAPLFEINYHRVILDEAHLIKNKNSLQSQACMDLKSTYKWAMTGTPLSNSIDDLYPYFKFLEVPNLEDWNFWTQYISKPVAAQRLESKKLLMKYLNTYLLRRTKQKKIQGKRILQLPEKITNVVRLDFEEEERKIYDILFSNTSDEYFNSQSVETYLELINQLRLFCDHPALYINSAAKKSKDLLPLFKAANAIVYYPLIQKIINGNFTNIDIELEKNWISSPKIDALMENILLTDSKSIVYSQWTSMLDLVEIEFEKENIKFIRLDGSLRQQQRDSIIKAFKKDDSIKFLCPVQSYWTNSSNTFSNMQVEEDLNKTSPSNSTIENENKMEPEKKVKEENLGKEISETAETQKTFEPDSEVQHHEENKFMNEEEIREPKENQELNDKNSSSETPNEDQKEKIDEKEALFGKPPEFLKNPNISEVYCYTEILKDKYKMTYSDIEGRRYKCRHWNGFMQILEEPYAESYFFCQAENEYLLPDWKFHVSVDPKDYEKTWNILIEIFFKYKLVAMKMQIQENWEKFGRGFTIYIPTKHQKFEDYIVEYQWDYKSEVLKCKLSDILDRNIDWWKVVFEIEKRLNEEDIISKHCELGDFALGKYVSLRNESFSPIFENGEWKNSYPPDHHGWNPAGHANFPFFEKFNLDFSHYIPPKRDKMTDQFELFNVFSAWQFRTYEFDKMLREIVSYKNKTIEFMENLVQSLFFCSFLCQNSVNQIKSIDLLFSIVEDKEKWGKSYIIRKLILDYLWIIIEFSTFQMISDYTKRKFQDMVNHFKSKSKSKMKTIISKHKRLSEKVKE